MTHTAFPTTVLKGALAGLVAVATLAPFAATANAADAATPQQPDIVSLLGDFENYYQPANAYDKTDPAKPFGKGTVKNAAVLKHDDETTQAINNAAATADGAGDGVTTPTAQQQRALIDSDYKMRETLPDALGPVLGKYLADGLDASASADGSAANPNGPLAKTYSLLISDHKSGSYNSALVSDWLDTGTAKVTFNHPRPFVDRTDAGYPAAGLDKSVGIKRVPVWTSADGVKHDAGYDGFLTSGSFPSGHTTYAYSGGIGLATLLPQLGTEIVTRASEAGNNRIVLGVHYPLDIMGGRIDGEVANATLWSDQSFRESKLIPAYNELQKYLADKCVADGNATKQDNDYDTVQACVTKLKANDTAGYQNSFVDPVSKTAVTDRASAIAVYTNRLTYGFAQTGATGQAPVVPDEAANLLLTAFPGTSDSVRKQILAASEIDSGYPLDASSMGYQRINLAKAYSANVTVNATGDTILKLTFGNKAPKVTTVKPDDVSALLADFNKYFIGGKGVTDEGKGVLAHDDKVTEDINNKAWGADGNSTQDQRAVSDAAMDSTTTLYDALGPVLGKYYEEGMEGCNVRKFVYDCKLGSTTKFLSWANYGASTGNAKTVYSHPRPYVDRVNYNGTTLDLNGLQQTLNIKKVPAYEEQGQYDGLASSGSFPSGHTTYAFGQGTGLAYLLPELGPEIMTRVSEAGNNRIVLGVHYPLDILGGHIAGQSGVANMIAAGTDDPNSEDYQTAYGTEARKELVDYLTARCKADGHGDTLAACIANTGAANDKGYTNDFTDEVSTKPVTDRKSAIAAYKARMTYGFQATGKTGQAAVVPDSAVRLLDNVEAFKSLTDDQKKAVLAATEGDSGYPLDASSKGWARVDLAAAYSAKVTLSADKKTVEKVEPGQAEASVVVASADTTAPVFSGVQDATVALNAKFDAMAGVTAKDDKDGDVTSNIKVEGSVNTAKAGKYTLTYTVSDKAGNTATAKRVITVAAKGTAPAAGSNGSANTAANDNSANGVKTAGQLGRTGSAVTGIALAVAVAVIAGGTMVALRRRDL
ncbi:acid phosphatase [Bifidobacterium primatium]|uniref:Acid phosphatase n=1 Tax=Bifidobacterium primatium TaxID=2045438 RepID=A0A2M9H968_9BIFI|nr:phosphatase PAP2 family protein [Bifidobacterium primatium]PJM73354.1 acid phosphatase [Bifidobacterium primatium]